MKIFNAQSVADSLPFDELIDALDAAFQAGANTPDRTHHEIEVPGKPDGTLLVMPCWQTDKNIGVKIATVFPAIRGKKQNVPNAATLPGVSRF